MNVSPFAEAYPKTTDRVRHVGVSVEWCFGAFQDDFDATSAGTAPAHKMSNPLSDVLVCLVGAVHPSGRTEEGVDVALPKAQFHRNSSRSKRIDVCEALVT